MEPKLGIDHGDFRYRMDAIVQNMLGINYSQLIQYEILEKLVTFMSMNIVRAGVECLERTARTSTSFHHLI